MDDLIKREDAIKGKMAGTATVNAEFLMGMDERERRIFSIGYADGWNEHIDKCKYDIPSAEKQGEWERIPYSFVGGFRCSCCGTKTLDDYWNFCPNCGARMAKK